MTTSDIIRAGDVFGVSRDLPLNYVRRDDIDGGLLDALSRDKHIVIHGSSKQGKTSLRKWNLDDDEYVLLSCQKNWNVAALHAAILKAVGYSVERSTSTTITGSHKVTAKFMGKLTGKLFGSGAEASTEVGGEREKESSTTVERAPMEIDPEDPNDIISALESLGFVGYIVLEDFHYLPLETQEAFAVALKTFHEASRFVFIVVGVWLDENRLVQHNGDLTGRVNTVNADAWTPEELTEVIHKGEALLNIRFTDTFKQSLIDLCFESVWVVQECCYLACTMAGVDQQSEQEVSIGDDLDVDSLVREVVEGQSARYNGFLEHFPEGFQTTKLDMYRWILLPVVATEPAKLEKGIHYNDLRDCIYEAHPEGFWDMSLKNALSRISDLQTIKKIKPPVLDYDASSRKLTVVDRGFLIWLAHQDATELKGVLGFSRNASGIK
jgi:hypothetical protein